LYGNIQVDTGGQMMQGASQDITELLLAWNGGDEQALDRLMPLVHDELHRLAHRYMGGQPADHPLQTTALVNEAYLRLRRSTPWCVPLTRHRTTTESPSAIMSTISIFQSGNVR
jgi:hypothetical protein